MNVCAFGKWICDPRKLLTLSANAPKYTQQTGALSSIGQWQTGKKCWTWTGKQNGSCHVFSHCSFGEEMPDDVRPSQFMEVQVSHTVLPFLSKILQSLPWSRWVFGVWYLSLNIFSHLGFLDNATVYVWKVLAAWNTLMYFFPWFQNKKVNNGLVIPGASISSQEFTR